MDSLSIKRWLPLNSPFFPSTPAILAGGQRYVWNWCAGTCSWYWKSRSTDVTGAYHFCWCSCKHCPREPLNQTALIPPAITRDLGFTTRRETPVKIGREWVTIAIRRTGPWCLWWHCVSRSLRPMFNVGNWRWRFIIRFRTVWSLDVWSLVSLGHADHCAQWRPQLATMGEVHDLCSGEDGLNLCGTPGQTVPTPDLLQSSRLCWLLPTLVKRPVHWFQTTNFVAKIPIKREKDTVFRITISYAQL